MYYPILKNKLNELKGLNDVDTSLDFIPILELTECKYEEFDKFVNYFASKIDAILLSKNIYIDIPSYINNGVVIEYSLNSAEEKFNFFLNLKKYFKVHYFREFEPVISFDYSYGSQKESYKENIKFVKKIMNHFDNFSIRIFSDYVYKNNDIDLINQIYTFLGDEIEDICTLIIDTDEHTTSLVLSTVESILADYKIKNIILCGEAFTPFNRNTTAYQCSRIENHHLKRMKYFKEKFDNKDISVPLNYADYSLLDKIPSKVEIEEGKGFLYYPFIKYTTEDGNLCMFTADHKGDYSQYQELCKRVKLEIKTFSTAHCSTCKFIDDVAEDKINKYKSGGTWKHRMVAHHITAVSKLS